MNNKYLFNILGRRVGLLPCRGSGAYFARGTLFSNNCPLCLELKVSQALALWLPRNMDGCPAPLGTDCMYLRT